MPAGALLAVIAPEAPVEYNSFGGIGCYDPLTDEVYLIQLATRDGKDGVMRLAIGTTGAPISQQLQSVIYPDGENMSGVSTFHPITKELFVSLGLSNSAPLGRIDVTGWTNVEIFGEASSSTAGSTNGPPARLLASAGLLPCWIDKANHHYIITTSVFNGEVAVLNVAHESGPTMKIVYNGVVAEPKSYIGGVRNELMVGSVPTAEFFALGYDPDPVAQTLGFYTYAITVDGEGIDIVTRTNWGHLTATQVDPTWDPRWGGFTAPGVDLADGNLVMSVLNWGATQGYLLKINATTGAIMWKLATRTLQSVDFAHSVMNGDLMVDAQIAANFISVIDLADGTVSSSIEFNHGLFLIENQIYNSAVKAVTGGLEFGGYVQGAGPIPSYLGAYLAANGNTTPNFRIVRAWPGVPNGQRSYVEVI